MKKASSAANVNTAGPYGHTATAGQHLAAAIRIRTI